MIRKFAMCSRQNVFFAPQKRDVPGRDYYPVEVELPVDKYWEIEELLKDNQYLQSNTDETVRSQELVKSVFKLLAPYAVMEKDRVYLYEQAGP